MLGGMGPLASAVFVQTIYEHSVGEYEQQFPAVVLHSDPTFPARAVFLQEGTDELLGRVLDATGRLFAHGCSTIIMCCMTLHHLLPELPGAVRHRVVSVVDVLMAGVVAAAPKRHLMLCSREARELGVFTRHPQWPLVRPFVVWPGAEDQQSLQAAIWDIKLHGAGAASLTWLKATLLRYGTPSFIVGCSEVHLLAKQCNALPGIASIDPFDVLARAVALHRLDALRSELCEFASA